MKTAPVDGLSNSQECYRFDSTAIAAKVIGSEVVMIDLESGTYFSLEGAASLSWQCLAKGHTLSQTIDVLSQYFEVSESTLANDLRSFVDQLLKEQILTPSGPAEVQKNSEKLQYPGSQAYHPPNLIVLRDMKDLMDMRLEPIAPLVE